jgi:hypothetical protein
VGNHFYLLDGDAVWVHMVLWNRANEIMHEIHCGGTCLVHSKCTTSHLQSHLQSRYALTSTNHVLPMDCLCHPQSRLRLSQNPYCIGFKLRFNEGHPRALGLPVAQRLEENSLVVSRLEENSESHYLAEQYS